MFNGLKTQKYKSIIMTDIRLHILAIPYTITNSEYSHDAFTGKVQKFSPMMRSRGFEVFHYGNEGSVSGANIDFQIFSKEEWQEYRIKSLMHLHKELTEETAKERLNDPKKLVGDLANWSTPLFEEFNRRLKPILKANYRSRQTDIVCIPLSHSYDNALRGENYTVVEVGIGYSGSCKDFRIFESYGWMNRTLGKENRQPHNYWFVIPHGFNVDEFKLSLTPNIHPIRIGYMGRIVSLKGCGIIVEIAKRFPHVEFVLCGQGDPTPFLTVPNIVYKPPIHGAERSDFLGSCVAFLHFAKYLEPFGCGPVEAQLCGTPVITHDHGGMVETVEQFKTGLLCHTLGEMCAGVKMAIDREFDRVYIRERAERMYNMYNLAHRYEYVFKTILEISGPNNGWLSPVTYMNCLVPKKQLNIALLLQGSIRHWQKTLPTFLKYVKNTNNMDIFLGHNTELIENLTEFKETCKTVSVVNEPIKYTHDYTKYPSERKDVNLHLMITRFINRQRVFQDFEQYAEGNNKKYDFVVSCFVNVEFSDFIRFDCLPEEEVVYIPRGDDWGGLNYRVAYGPPNAMAKYMNLYTNLIPLLQNGCIPHPETLMKRYVEDISLNIVRSTASYKHV